MNKKFALALVLGLGALSSFAVSPAEQQLEELKKSHHTVNIDKDTELDSLTEKDLIGLFYYDQFRHFQDPRAPYFMLMSKTHQYAMGVGGVVRMRGWYDWNGAMQNSAFIPYNISIPNDPTRDRWFGTTPAGTALIFSVFGRRPPWATGRLATQTQLSPTLRLSRLQSMLRGLIRRQAIQTCCCAGCTQ